MKIKNKKQDKPATTQTQDQAWADFQFLLSHKSPEFWSLVKVLKNQRKSETKKFVDVQKNSKETK